MDISLSNISDMISVSTYWGFTAFIAIVIAYAVGQYLILEFVKQKSKRIRLKSRLLKTILYNDNSTICFDSQYRIYYFTNICELLLLHFHVNLVFINQLYNSQHYNGDTCFGVLFLV